MDIAPKKTCARCSGWLSESVRMSGICMNCRSDDEKRLFKSERKKHLKELHDAERQILDAIIVNCIKCGRTAKQFSLQVRTDICAECRTQAYQAELEATKKAISLENFKANAVIFSSLALIAVLLVMWFTSGETTASQSAPAISQPYRDEVKQSVWSRSEAAAKIFIEARVRDPSSVKYNKWQRSQNDKFIFVTVDFTAVNGFGGPTRAEWMFYFDRRFYKMEVVLDKTNERVLLDESK